MKQLNYKLVLFCAFILTINYAYSFNRSVTILVKGKVVDEFTGQPVETTVEFKTSKGKKFRIKTNSLDGTFEQVFSAGDNVEMKLYHWNVARKYYHLNIKDTIAYTEQYEKFTVKKLAVGNTLFRFNIFKSGSSEFVYGCKQMLDSIEHLLRFARNIKVVFNINIRDSYARIKKVVQPEPVKKKKRKRRKKKKPVKPQPQIVIEEPDTQVVATLADSRMGKLNSIIQTWKRFRKKISIKTDTGLLFVNEGNPLDTGYDMEVIVTEVKSTMR